MHILIAIIMLSTAKVYLIVINIEEELIRNSNMDCLYGVNLVRSVSFKFVALSMYMYKPQGVLRLKPALQHNICKSSVMYSFFLYNERILKRNIFQ
jgi:hypothetical protein